jgi:CheY-like chemotaxis protein
MMSTTTLAEQGRPVEILLVEDNYGDMLLTIDAFANARIANNFQVASNGEQALQMLRKEGVYYNVPTPDMVLLDLNIPKIDGKEVLAEIKRDETLKRIPVVILTSSKAEMDITRSYDMHAASYIIKPMDLKKFGDVVKAIENFWFTVAVLPDKKN